MRKVDLPSGKVLSIDLPRFEVSLALYQALMEKMVGVEIRPNNLDTVLYKDYLAGCLASQEIQEKLWECFKKCLYGELHFDTETFQSREAREDYIKVCMEVVKENTDPFVRGLYSEFPVMHDLMLLLTSPKSKSTTTPS